MYMGVVKSVALKERGLSTPYLEWATNDSPQWACTPIEDCRR